MLGIRFLISCAIPDKPDWVATEMAKVEFARRNALNRLSSTTTTPPSSASAFTIPTKNDISSYESLDQPFNQNIRSLLSTTLLTLDFSRITHTLIYHLCRCSEDFRNFQTTDDAKSESDQIFIDAVESDISQSVDNIDRILQNIDEETEYGLAPQPLCLSLIHISEPTRPY